MTDRDELERLWHSERLRLLGLASAMLRDRIAAEDVVQEVFIRFAARQSSSDPADRLRNPAAWLSVAAAHLCLDQLKSARSRRETTGHDDVWAGPAASSTSRGDDPLDHVTLDDEIRQAVLVVLERLTPEERVSFVLHDLFRLGFAEIAEVAGISVANSRQLAHRARRKVADGDWRTSEAASRGGSRALDVTTERFLAACRGGSLEELVGVLRPDAWGVAFTSDGEKLQENHGGRAVAANLLRFLAPPTVLVVVGPQIHAFRGLRWFARVDLGLADERVSSLAVTVDPGAWTAMARP
jgi:RNA polymerase sigma-70 factor (ECF subfamily)